MTLSLPDDDRDTCYRNRGTEKGKHFLEPIFPWMLLISYKDSIMTQKPYLSVFLLFLQLLVMFKHGSVKHSHLFKQKLLTPTCVPQSLSRGSRYVPFNATGHKTSWHEQNSSTLSLSTSLSPKWHELQILPWQKDLIKTSGQKEPLPPLWLSPWGKVGATYKLAEN